VGFIGTDRDSPIMQTRNARPADRPAIRDVARRSLERSYSLSPQAITTAVEKWYDEGELADRFGDPSRLFLVSERDDQIVAFSESVHSESGDEATLLWLHVDPAYRGEGIATELFDVTVDRLHEEGFEHVYGRVLDDNTDGNAFYESRGLEKVGEDTVEIGERTYVENVWTLHESSGLEAIENGDGETVFVDYTESDTGSAGHFYTVYSDEEKSSQYGYFCANCDNLANAMDSMGRIECNHCGNTRKPSRWDAAYL